MKVKLRKKYLPMSYRQKNPWPINLNPIGPVTLDISPVLNQLHVASPSLLPHVFTKANPFLPPQLFPIVDPILVSHSPNPNQARGQFPLASPSHLFPRVNLLLTSHLSNLIPLSKLFKPLLVSHLPDPVLLSQLFDLSQLAPYPCCPNWI